MKIVMIGEAATHQQEIAQALDFPAEFIALPREAHESAQWDDQIDGADVLVAMRFQRKTPPPAFRLLHVPGAGLDGIDFAALPTDCSVCNVYEHEIPMAEYTLAAMLQHEVRLVTLRASFDSQHWSETYLSRTPRGELYGRTLLIVGFGRIGQAIASRAQAFGVRVIAISGHAQDGKVEGPADEAWHPDNLLEHLPRADYVVLSCPLNDKTRDSFGHAQLEAMRADAVLINIARAAVVNEQALYEALEQQKISRAFLDVWYQYPAGSNDRVAPAHYRFEQLPNAVCTPHISGWTSGLFARRYALIADNIQRLQQHRPLNNLVHGRAQQ
ncbi:2-hydroxyacid dehydrogenase [Erwiniaceae bacterium BAC15a-03b]|uniref:2-hydroxyacid dehydrogenase n=1 Tax=Winslowiella arboricola TaxID=2978220 RepID=A0A9J6PJ01_9GAMM|nr:2-hydroxyacid dehydrogenase [Winslowiella arboricola]MCU5772755.1 2-hydroxyacid dehydrogenase [Winslowiella arboricola]MCU5778305.1 2-hydroxyacid dehydrogenase [Winslowiella arboricola]